MANLHFNAVLAKNNIAMEMADYEKTATFNMEYVIFNLKEIEKYIGQYNQPSVNEVFKG
jgi:nitrogenase subunit NifH